MADLSSIACRKLLSSRDFDIVVKDDPDTIVENISAKNGRSTLASANLNENSRGLIGKG